MVRDTSLKEYINYRKNKNIIAHKVYKLMLSNINGRGLTGWEVAKKLQLPITSIRPRLTDLVKNGFLKAERKGVCTVILKMCILYEVA